MRFTSILAATRKLPENYHNMPRKFIERHTTFLDRRAPRMPQFEQKIFRYKRKAYYDIWRPWEDQFKRLNAQHVKVSPVFVEPIRDFPYFRGDRVEILKGPDKGKQGNISYIVKERNWVLVRGLNLSREYVNRGEDSMGNLICQEEPLLVNHEVKLVDPSDLMPTDIEWQYDEEGNRVRVSTRTKRLIPIPESAYETMNYYSPEDYKDQPKDTPAKLVKEISYRPESKTFEMDICDQIGIKDDRVPYPMYWY